MTLTVNSLAAFTDFSCHCCSLWVFEPDARLGLRIWQLMNEGNPRFDKQGGVLINNVTGKQEVECFRLSDMAIVQAMFSDWPRNYDHYRLFPWIRDNRHGHVAGLRSMPMYAVMSDKQWNDTILDGQTGRHFKEGFREESVLPEDRGRPVWHGLNISYDQCASHCDCLPWRWPSAESNEMFSVHFSCLINNVEKPGEYASEHHLFSSMIKENWTDCSKYYYLSYYDQLTAALGGPLLPAYDGPRPTVNMTVLNKRVAFRDSDNLPVFTK